MSRQVAKIMGQSAGRCGRGTRSHPPDSQKKLRGHARVCRGPPDGVPRRLDTCRVFPGRGRSDGHRVSGGGEDAGLVDQFLAHLGSRAFSPATVRAYAYDLLNFLRFLAGRRGRLADMVPTDLSTTWTGSSVLVTPQDGGWSVWPSGAVRRRPR